MSQTREAVALELLDALTQWTRTTGYVLESDSVTGALSGRYTGARDPFVTLVCWDDETSCYSGTVKDCCGTKRLWARI